MDLKNLKLKRKILFFSRTILIFLIIITLLAQIKHIIVASSVNFITQSESTSLDKPVSILFLGADYGDTRGIDTSTPPRADTIITLTLNPNNQNGNIELNLTSIPRDTRMPITCNGNQEDKINSAFSYGYLENGDIDDAITCTKDTVSQFFGVEIDYYILANFDTFINLIDSIGGIEINVPYSFYEMDSDDNVDALYFEEGLQTLDGEHALAYARQRHAINPETGLSGDDFERNIRQQEVLMATISKILSNPGDYIDNVISIVYNDMETNLNISIMTNFANFGVTLLNNFINNLANHQITTIFLKSNDNQKTIDINPYEDLLGIDYNANDKNYLDYWYTNNSDSSTQAIPIYIDYRDFNFASSSNEITTNNQNFEIMMSTINTDPAEDGTGDELVTYDTRLYYSNLLANSLGQEADLSTPMNYYSE